MYHTFLIFDANIFLEAMLSGNYGSKADVFSFGISLFAIFTCKKPYGIIFDNIRNQFKQMKRIEEAVTSGVRPEPLPDQPLGIRQIII